MDSRFVMITLWSIICRFRGMEKEMSAIIAREVSWEMIGVSFRKWWVGWTNWWLQATDLERRRLRTILFISLKNGIVTTQGILSHWSSFLSQVLSKESRLVQTWARRILALFIALEQAQTLDPIGISWPRKTQVQALSMEGTDSLRT